MAEFKKINKYFMERENANGTYDVADRKGNVFAKGVMYSTFNNSERKDYITTGDYEKVTLWNKKGCVMPGAENVGGITIHRDGSYTTYCDEKYTYYDNGAKTKKILMYFCALTISLGGGIGFNVGINVGYNIFQQKKMEKEAAEKILDATYMGSVARKAYFDTNKDKKDAEFNVAIDSDKAAVIFLNMQQGETKKVSEWRKMGLDLKPIEKVKE